jgi:hypothetical protein
MFVPSQMRIRRLVQTASAWFAFSTGTALIALAGCGSSSATTGRVTAPGVPQLAHWVPFVHVLRPLDVVGPRRDGSLVLAAGGRLMLLDPATRTAKPFAVRYRSPGGEEPYIALATRGCLGTDAVYALHLRPPRGVVAVSSQGAIRRLARLNTPGLIDGIAFDQTGAFGHRLLVTTNHGSTTTVDAVDCHGRVTTLTRDAPRVEGGIAVAPRSFGRFAGDLIAPDEKGGGVFAITPTGKSKLLAPSGLPHGPDTGVESAGFVPPGGRVDAFMADRVSRGNRHPGDDVVLWIRHPALSAAGVRPGDLLVATEGGARTVAIRCTDAGCRVRHIADGPAIAHGEGHIAFAPTAG